MSLSVLACEQQTFLLAYRCWGTSREEESLRLSDRNSILMTQNLSEIRSEALIGGLSSYITRMTDKRQKASKFGCGTPWPQDILYKHWFTLSVAESQTFLRAKRPQRRSARRNGCFRRLLLYTPFFKRYRGTAGSLGIIIIIQACKAGDNLYTKRKFVLYPVARIMARVPEWRARLY